MSLTKVTYSMIAGAPVLVDDFIPAGVNTATTDVSSYIQDAIDSLPIANTGIRGHLAFSNKRYNLGTPLALGAPAVLVDRPMLISGNGATLFVTGAATGRVWRVNAPFVTMQDFIFTKETFPLTSTADLTGEALSMYADSTRPCQKWQLINIEITGFQYGMVFFGGTAAGCSYGDVYSPRIRFTAYGMVFDEADVLNAYCTDINVFGGELSLDGFGNYNNSRGIDIRNTTSFTVTNGINFYGTNIEGSWQRKLRCEGQQCSFNNMYWDDTNGGTDIEFVNNGSGQVSKNNLVVGGSPLHIQVVANTSGEINSLIDPNKGIGFGNPVLTASTAFQFTQSSAGGGGVSGVIANSGAPSANTSASLKLQAKKANGTLVDMAFVDGTTVTPTGEGQGRIGLYARNSGGYGYPVALGDGETGNFYPGVDNVGSCGTASYRWSVVYAATGTINTSDSNEKQDIQSLSDAEKQVALAIKSSIKKFRFKSAVEKKGENARIHFGVIAQEVKAAFEAQGLDASRYGVFCSDIFEDGSERLGVRYEELLAFVVAAI